MSFAQWMDEVDTFVWMLAGCSIYDLPGCNLRDWYEDELTPNEAATRAVVEAR